MLTKDPQVRLPHACEAQDGQRHLTRIELFLSTSTWIKPLTPAPSGAQRAAPLAGNVGQPPVRSELKNLCALATSSQVPMVVNLSGCDAGMAHVVTNCQDIDITFKL
ncbi:hypothetical protein PsAD37_04242 [Pseudovibrio sp. Ad37]|nr:hypothetical protein PsAD37_04242 [Pseudovibrio sp. Ad37]